MIDVAIRLRRAIYLNDLTLVQRIVRNNPASLQNPDFGDKSNTSLHLAARFGYLEITTFLIESGHEDEGISRNTEWDTPLMVACAHSQVDVGLFLLERFPRCVPWTNKLGRDALMITSLTGDPSYPLLIPLLSSNPPCLPSAHDTDGNTALHHAAAAGHTKALRTLLQFGASPVAQNAYSWTPIAYSASKQLELYFRELVAEFERKRVEGAQKERELREQQELRRRGVAGGVRLVTELESFAAGSAAEGEAASEAEMRTLPPGLPPGSMAASSSAYADDGLRTPTSAVSSRRDGGSWSPVERWRQVGTPSGREREREEWIGGHGGNRGRAWSGE